AFKDASNPHAFCEQIDDLGLETWEVSKLYCRCRNQATASCNLDLREAQPRLSMPAGEFVRAAAALIDEQPGEMPSDRSFRIVDNRLDAASGRGGLMDGIVLAPAGVARRELPPLPAIDPSAVRNEKVLRTLTTLASAPSGPLTSPEQVISQVGSQLASLPE